MPPSVEHARSFIFKALSQTFSRLPSATGSARTKHSMKSRTQLEIVADAPSHSSENRRAIRRSSNRGFCAVHRGWRWRLRCGSNSFACLASPAVAAAPTSYRVYMHGNPCVFQLLMNLNRQRRRLSQSLGSPTRDLQPSRLLIQFEQRNLRRRHLV